MYQSYWQLNEKPFEQGFDPRFYYPGDAHQAALLRLRYTIENQRGAVLVAGAGGTGKTLLAQTLKRHLPEHCTPFVHLVFPQMPTADLLAYLADEIGAPRPESASKAGGRTVEESIRRLQESLASNAEQGRHAVVVIDEAHLLDEVRSLEAMRLLLNFEHEGRPLLTFVLVGQPPLLTTVQRMPQLEERMAVKCLLRAFTPDETAAYVSHRVNAAGAARAIFDAEALETLHFESQGIPRRLNRLCELALLIGYADERASITREQIEAVSQELSVAVAA